MPTLISDAISLTGTLRHPSGDVQVADLSNGQRRLTVQMTNASLFMPIGECDTAYPLELIQGILEIKGPQYLCDEILRDESPSSVQRSLTRDLHAYFEDDWFVGKRVLDFGCGAGASTMCLARLLPESRILGIELDPRLMGIARRRLQLYGYPHVSLALSPSPLALSPGIGRFDCVILSAVYEHMLPHERAQVLPLIWSVIEPGGFLFINQTPHRYFPYESHSTSLPFINYLPDGLAHAFARLFSRRVRGNEPWESLLRDGIRGATEQEIIGILSRAGPCRPILLEPWREGLRDRIDLWHAGLNPDRYRTIKRLLKGMLKLIKSLTSLTLVPDLSLVIRKDGGLGR